MTCPLVSVVMSVRNSQQFVESAVRSALAQTHSSLEMIVVDDGSVDGTSDILGRIRDDRLRIVRTERRGSAAARNAGICETLADYVAFLDGDDLWEPKKLERHIAFMESAPDVDLTFSQSRLIDKDGIRLPIPVRRVCGRYDFKSLLRDNVIGNGSAVVVRRAAIPDGGFNENLSACVDYELWLRIALARRGNVAAISEVLTLYRRHAGQVSGDWRRMQVGWELLIQRMRDLTPETTIRVEPAARANWYRYLAFVAYEQEENHDAIRLITESFRAAPVIAALTPRTWLLAGAIAVRALIKDGASRPRELDRSHKS